MKELKKEMIAVERRIMEELKKAEEAKARLEEEKARQIRKRKLKILFLVLVLIAVIIIIACLYAKGYLKF
jgi:cell division septal protein FtsQ